MPRTISSMRPARALIVNVALLLLGTAFMQSSYAGCGKYQAAAEQALNWESSSSLGGVRFLRAGYTLVADEDSDSWQRHDAAITGLWYFQYLSKGNKSLGIPDGAVLDDGNTIWFADGNEMTSSAMRAPDTGSICLGTWKKTGEATYELNHIGLSWDPVKNVFAGPAFIKQFVTLEGNKDKYTGAVTIIQYAADGKTVEVELKGVIVANRVTVSSTKQP